MSRELFDASSGFDAEIEPLTLQLKELCEKHGAPLLVLVTYAQLEIAEGAYTQAVAWTMHGKGARMAEMQRAMVMLQALPEGAQQKIMEGIDVLYGLLRDK